MSKTVRVRTTPNGDDTYIKLKVDQDFDFIEILSLKISQAEAYTRFCSDYGVVVGRVIVNNGFGVPNAKVSIFVPLSDDDASDSDIKGLYPYTNIDDKDSEGIRYNLLQGDNKVGDACFTPVGTFPSKRDVIDNDTILEVFDKYYKFTTTTNDAGDFMLFGVPTGNHTLNVDVDLSDIGIASQRPYDYITDGESNKRFESPTKFKSDKDLDKLMQIKTFKKGVNVQPFWGDKEQCDIGISRVDVDIKKKITPSAIFMGSFFSDSEKNSINKNCRPRKDFGRLCETSTSEGFIEMIRKNIDGDIERFDVEGGRVINEFGSWAYQIPMNLNVMVTNEFGQLVPSEDPNKGLATKASVRFRISKDITGDEGKLRTTANYLVPHNPTSSSKIDYNFDENTSDENFRDLHWNKIYSVSNFIPRVQPLCIGDSCADNRNMTGIKDVDDCVAQKNPFPFNRVDTDINPLFTIICIIMSIITLIIWLINSTVISFVNSFIFLLNGILKVICNLVFGFAKTICNIVSVLPKVKKDKCLKSGCIKSGGYSNKRCDCNSVLSYVPCITLECPSDGGEVYAPGCNCSGVTDSNAAIRSGDSTPNNGISVSNLGCWWTRVNVEKGMNVQHWSGLNFTNKHCPHAGHNTVGAGLTDCFAIQLAEELNMFEFDFYNDWVNGTLYGYLLKYKKKKRGAEKFCDTDCDSPDSDNKCDKSYFVDTGINGEDDRNDIKKTSKMSIDEGFVKSITTFLDDGTEVNNLYYAPYAKNLSRKLFATDLIHLGSVFECDWQGIPKIQQYLIPTTYKRAPYTDEWLTDANGNSTIKVTCGMTSTGGNGSSGVFFDIDCLGLKVGQIAGNPRLDNIKRQCEFGMNLDELNGSVGPDCYLNDNDLNGEFAIKVRDILYQLNINNGPTKLNSWPSTGLPNNLATGFGTGKGSDDVSTTTIGTEYKEFRGITNGQSYFTKNNGSNDEYQQPKNSYYFYFGTEVGQSAIDLMNRKFFTTCDTVVKNDFVISGEISNASVNGTCDGSIDISVIGGTAPFIYTWSGPNGYINPSSSIGDISNLCAGTYNLSVTDDTGGSSRISFSVTEPSPFSCNVLSTNSITNGGNGSITIQTFGGIPPYTYSINGNTPVTINGSSETIISPAGTYVVTTTDSDNNTCTNPSTGVTITEPALLSIQGLTTFVDTSCGLENGELSVALNSSIGGVPPYSILITSNTTPNDGSGPIQFSSINTMLTGLSPGTYNINISDGSTPQQTDSDSVVIDSSVESRITYLGGWYCWSYNNSYSENIKPRFNVAANGAFTITATPRDASNNELPNLAVSQSFPANTTTLTFSPNGNGLRDLNYSFEMVDDKDCVSEAFGDFRPTFGHVPSIAQRLDYIPEDYCWTNTKPSITPKFNVWAEGPFKIYNGNTLIYTNTLGVPLGDTISITTVQPTSTNTEFRLVETTHNCSVSEFVNLSNQHPSSRLIGNASQTTSTGGLSNGRITVSPSGGYSTNYTYRWFKNNVITNKTTATATVLPSDLGSTWKCRITDANNCIVYSNNLIIT